MKKTLSKFKLDLKEKLFLSRIQLCSRKNTYFTFTDRNDGIGAQIHAAISVILFAHDLKVQYAHTPFLGIAHKPLDDLDWDAKWDIFFGLKHYQKQVQQLNFNSTNHYTLYSFNNCFDYMDKNIFKINSIKSELRRCYYSSPKKNFLSKFTDKKKVNISVHIRRGDSLLKENSYRLTGKDYIFQSLTNICNFVTANGHEYRISIFSQGKHEDFQYLSSFKNLNLFLDKDLFMTFDSLVSSDILVIAKSSFSYVAALLSDNMIFYEPFWHPPLQHWISLDNLNPKALNKRSYNYFLPHKKYS